MAWLARPAYKALTAVWAQTQQDALRLRQLGAPVKGVLGNLKFDAAPDTTQLALGRRWRSRLGQTVLMFASSREGEEQAFLAALKLGDHTALGGADSDNAATASPMQWLIVPRHPQRFDAVQALIEAHGYRVLRRSAWTEAGPSAAAVSDGLPTVWLGDSLGEMALYYGLSDVALLGGSFEPLGGQNLIEAAACACPVVMGPHTFNFAEAAEQAAAAGAAMRVSDMAAALALAQQLTADAAQLARAKHAASGFAQAHRGAAQRLAQALLPLLTAQGHRHSS
jgi:3-deoxy-D-manno-octulosonic-acid transferase